MRQEMQEFYSTRSQGTLVTSAGLIPRLARQLAKQGHTVHVQDATRWQVLEGADHSLFQDADVTEDDRCLLKAVSRTPRGQILVGREHDIPAVVALLVRFFESARVLVVCNNRKATDTTYRALCHLLGKGVYLHTDVNWADQRRVVVGSGPVVPSTL